MLPIAGSECYVFDSRGGKNIDVEQTLTRQWQMAVVHWSVHFCRRGAIDILPRSHQQIAERHVQVHRTR